MSDPFERVQTTLQQRGVKESELEELRDQLHRDFDRRFNRLLDPNAYAEDESSSSVSPSDSQADLTAKKPRTYRKEFKPRESLITTILTINHIRTIQHVFIASLAIVVMDSAIRDVVRYQVPDLLKMEAVRFAFGRFDQVIVVWLWMFAATLATYVFFHVWAHRGADTTGSENRLWLLGYGFYLAGFMYYPAHYLACNEMPPASGLVIGCEQIRLSMKIYAFVRENIPRAIRVKQQGAQQGQNSESPCPDFNRFLYFLFCPTLVYRDDYPRTEKVRWSVVIEHFLSWAACVFYCNYMFVHFAKPVFQNFAQEKVTVSSFLEGVFACVFPASIVFLLTFYGMLHCWMNAFAEMLRFGDRLFYKDWWNSTSFSNYYRTWNMVVHDWLFNYIYLDLMKTKVTGKTLSSLAVFFISAVVHEFIISAAFRFFYPVLFALFFGFGVLVYFTTSKWQHYNVCMNVFMWFALFLGVGVCMCLYSIEFYARRNCAPSFGLRIVSELLNAGLRIVRRTVGHNMCWAWYTISARHPLHLGFPRLRLSCILIIPCKESYWLDLVVPRSWICRSR